MHRWLAWGAPEYRLERTQWVPGEMQQVMDFFSDPHNLPRITPSWLHFHIERMEPAVIEKGTRIDYRLKYLGIPYRWRTQISDWEPGERFVDRMLRGPYILWHHTHTFETSGDGILLRDVVRYRLPFGPIGILMHVLIVRRQLDGIFDYRQKQVAAILADGKTYLAPPQAA